MIYDLAKKELRMREIAAANAAAAIDQAGDYKSEHHARASYLLNAIDTIEEEGSPGSRTLMVLYFEEAYRDARLDAARLEHM